MTPAATAWLLVAAVVVIWGLSWPILGMGVELVHPLWLAALRFVFGAATLAVFMAWRRIRPEWPRGEGRAILLVAATHMVGYNALGIGGLAFVEASRAVVLAFTTALWVTPLAWAVLGERPSGRALAGLALGMAGLMVLFRPGAFDWSDANTIIGNALILAAAMSYAASMVLTRRHAWRTGQFNASLWQMLAASAFLVPLAWAVGGLPLPDPAAGAGTGSWIAGAESGPAGALATLAGVVLYVGVIATGFAYCAIATATRRLPAAATAMGLLATPVAGIAFATTLFGEPLSANLVAGCSLMLAGIGLGTWPSMGQ